MMVDAIAYAAGFLAMLSFLPQVLKTLRRKKAGDVSVAMLTLTLVTNALYATYGALMELYPIVIMLGIMSVIVLFQLLLTLKYRDHHPNS